MQIKQTDRMSLTLSKLGTICFHSCTSSVLFVLRLFFCHLAIPSGPEVIKLFSCSTQLCMKIFMLINVKMPTIVGILTFMSRKNSILQLSEPDKS